MKLTALRSAVAQLFTQYPAVSHASTAALATLAVAAGARFGLHFTAAQVAQVFTVVAPVFTVAAGVLTHLKVTPVAAIKAAEKADAPAAKVDPAEVVPGAGNVVGK